MNAREYLNLVPPLHRAICDGDKVAVNALLAKNADRDARDPYGYTAGEIASLLGHGEWALALGEPPPSTIKVVKEGECIVQRHTPETLLRTMGIAYTPTLRFNTLDVLLDVIKSGRKPLGDLDLSLKVETPANITVAMMNPEMGYGVFNNRNLAAGEYIGTYTGAVRRIRRVWPNLNAYCVLYPTRWWAGYYVIDASFYGNDLRYVNHSDLPNLTALWTYDRGLWNLAFYAIDDIPRGSHLTVDYGTDFWRRRRKYTAEMPEEEIEL